MKNLAGSKDRTFCDEEIRDELERAGITIVEVPQNDGEVQYSLIGELETPYGKMTFRRAWYYWMVDCKVPLELANKIYKHPEGKRTVRANGDCGCVSPQERAEYFYEGKCACLREEYEKGIDFFKGSELNNWLESYIPVDDFSCCDGFVSCYHIDDQAGLLLFALAVTGKVKI